jgi:Ca2+-binding RTX toxin-like protein
VQDAFLEVFDASGDLLVSADGGADTPVNQVNSGFDVLLTFEAQTTGTYYINARAFDNDPTVGGATGEGVGDYEVFAEEVDANDPTVYRPYYDVDSPLYALDWGTQVDGTVRNPDGAESGHVTGNPQGTPDAKDGVSVEGKNIITIYFAAAGDLYTPEDPTSPGIPPAIVAVGAKEYEVEAVMVALDEFEKVADVEYVVTTNRDAADFHYVTYSGTPGPGVSLLGSMSPPQESDEGLAQFNSGDYRWNETNLQQGGFSFVTLIHEFGHGHGMAHPHDNGGRSGIMNGVTADGPVADYTTGDFELNQGVFTMMSYQDGWQTSPHGNAATDVGYGYLGGLMAFDIAVIQDKYGVNEETATGDDIYRLKDVNAAGTFYSSIWDAAGTDAIAYDGARNSNIDLRAATLRYEVGGGGNVSYADGIFGGFTVANGVVIENASSGSGNDILTGNDVTNRLEAGEGNDALRGGLGHDVLVGGSGADRLIGGGGADVMGGSSGNDLMAGGLGNDTYWVFDEGDVILEELGEGRDTVIAHANVTLSANAEDVRLFGDARSATGNDLRNSLTGSDGADTLKGLGGTDVLRGGVGGDSLTSCRATPAVTSCSAARVPTGSSWTMATAPAPWRAPTRSAISRRPRETGSTCRESTPRVQPVRTTASPSWERPLSRTRRASCGSRPGAITCSSRAIPTATERPTSCCGSRIPPIWSRPIS